MRVDDSWVGSSAQGEGEGDEVLRGGGEFQRNIVPRRGAESEIDVGHDTAGGDGLVPNFRLVCIQNAQCGRNFGGARNCEAEGDDLACLGRGDNKVRDGDVEVFVFGEKVGLEVEGGAKGDSDSEDEHINKSHDLSI